mmetsp:Transcript_10582/g.13773  ORF Transcript_10582/g.13773 Transcript_10582/m.13773 type:complete len:238 (+) Transcript_10582:122-835(+)|eukprot:CAMPEP_0116060796 /NCGR_PEP_ID=MMETSP0322-20121206/6643_1 /TAXON_ID=163516 /ORGANISM="Leptocylindrus danicus var. apora, Strain B651" /LENGTH=237 /DNA_ID=CAMNT_0003545513 /DNA_START=27 /DNA_END=740 /DNA_ORIENTATION=+
MSDKEVCKEGAKRKLLIEDDDQCSAAKANKRTSIIKIQQVPFLNVHLKCLQSLYDDGSIGQDIFQSISNFISSRTKFLDIQERAKLFDEIEREAKRECKRQPTSEVGEDTDSNYCESKLPSSKGFQALNGISSPLSRLHFHDSQRYRSVDAKPMREDNVTGWNFIQNLFSLQQKRVYKHLDEATKPLNPLIQFIRDELKRLSRIKEAAPESNLDLHADLDMKVDLWNHLLKSIQVTI